MLGELLSRLKATFGRVGMRRHVPIFKLSPSSIHNKGTERLCEWGPTDLQPCHEDEGSVWIHVTSAQDKGALPHMLPKCSNSV